MSLRSSYLLGHPSTMHLGLLLLPYPRWHYADRVSGRDVLYPPVKGTDIFRNCHQWCCRGPSLRERPLENWISALRDMTDRLGEKKKANDGIWSHAEGADFSLYDTSNEMVNPNFFIPPTPPQQLVGTTTDEQPTTTMSALSAKRMKQLDSMFTGLRNVPDSALEHHN
jgi:hypothetical protein